MRVFAFSIAVLLTAQACRVTESGETSTRRIPALEIVGEARTYSVQPLGEVAVKWPDGIVFDDQSRLLVMDKEDSRLLVVRDDAVVDVLGRLGQGLGEFFRPAGLSYSNGKLFIADQGNYRIQILETDGTPVSDFLVSFAPGYLAGNQYGQVLVNNPKGGSLFDVYDQFGMLIGQRGSLLNPTEAYPDRPRLNRTTLNRGFILADDKDGVFVVFQFAPIVQKWNVQGRLMWERRIGGEEIDRLVAGLFGEAGGKKYSVKSTEGEPSLSIIVSASCLASTGELVVALSDQTLFRISPDGSSAVKIKPEGKSRKTFNAMAEHEGSLFFASESRLFRSHEELSTGELRDEPFKKR